VIYTFNWRNAEIEGCIIILLCNIRSIVGHMRVSALCMEIPVD